MVLKGNWTKDCDSAFKKAKDLIKQKTQATRLRDTQTNNQANPSVFHIQRSRVQTRQNREHIFGVKEIAT